MSHFALHHGRLTTTLSLLAVLVAGAAAAMAAGAPATGAAGEQTLPPPAPKGEIRGAAPAVDWVGNSTASQAQARIAADPADPVGYLELAGASWRAGDFAGSARALEQGRRQARPSALLLVALGSSYIALNRLADAEEATQAALTLEPEVAGAQLQLGRIYGLIGWPESAVECYEKAVSVSPQDVEAKSALVLGLVAAGRAESAEKQCREFLRGDDTAQLWVALGETLEAQEVLRDAFNAYGRALVLDASHAGAHARRGRLFCRFGQFDAAATECRAALAIDPDNALAHAYLGIAYSYQGQTEAAREHALRAQQAGMRMDSVWDRLNQ